MSGCDTLRTDLKAYQDGRLSLLKRLRVRRHLRRCESCRQELAQILQIGKELRQMEPDGETLDPGLRARILASIPEGLPDPPDAIASLRGRSRSLALWGGLAAAALVAVVVYPRLASNPRSHYSQETVSTMKGPGVSSSAGAPAAARPQAPPMLANQATITRNANTGSDKRIAYYSTSGSSASGAPSGGGRSVPAGVPASPPPALAPSGKDTDIAPSVMDQAKSVVSSMKMAKTQNDDMILLVVQVDDLKEGQKKVHRIANAMQGTINVEQQTGGESCYLEINVPAAHYADARVQLSQLQSEQKREAPSHSTPADVKQEAKKKLPLLVAPTSQGSGRAATIPRSKRTEEENQKQSHALPSGASMPMRTLHITLEQKPSPPTAGKR